MSEKLVPWDSIFLSWLKSFFQKINCLLTKIGWYLKRFVDDIVYKFKLASCSPGCMPMKNFIKNKPDGPNITLWSIWFPFQKLYRHVQRGSYCRLMLQFLGYIFFCEAKITNLHFSVGNEDVGRFQIPGYFDDYLCTTPSRTKVMNPLQISVSTLIASISSRLFPGLVFR